jgi:hypothetical protein
VVFGEEHEPVFRPENRPMMLPEASKWRQSIDCDHVVVRPHHNLTESGKLQPDNAAAVIYFAAMSAAEIIKELPKLSEADRRAIREVLLEIANQDPDIAICNQAALEGAMILDRMEDEDASRQSR